MDATLERDHDAASGEISLVIASGAKPSSPGSWSPRAMPVSHGNQRCVLDGFAPLALTAAAWSGPRANPLADLFQQQGMGAVDHIIDRRRARQQAGRRR